MPYVTLEVQSGGNFEVFEELFAADFSSIILINAYLKSSRRSIP